MPLKWMGLLAVLMDGVPRYALGFSSGAPLAACMTMEPQHGYKPMKTPCPYEIVFDKQVVLTNETLTVTMKSKKAKKTFMGFMVLAKNQFDEIVGTFSEREDYELLHCDEKKASCATQSDNIPVEYFNVTWKPPEWPKIQKKHFKKLNVKFYVTYVKNMDFSWAKQVSEKTLEVKDAKEESLKLEKPNFSGFTDMASTSSSLLHFPTEMSLSPISQISTSSYSSSSSSSSSTSSASTSSSSSRESYTPFSISALLHSTLKNLSLGPLISSTNYSTLTINSSTESNYSTFSSSMANQNYSTLSNLSFANSTSS